MRFLIVDDSPTSRKLTMTALRTFGYNDTIEAEDGVQALKVLKSTKVDIVITDWNMPNLNGLELTNLIRSDEDLKHLPIILCTTRGQKDDIIFAIKSRVNGYIVKPFTPKTLKEKLTPVLRKYEERKAEVLKNKDMPISISFDAQNIASYNHVSLVCSLRNGKEIINNYNLNMNLLKTRANVKKLVSSLIIESNKAFIQIETFDINNEIIDSQKIDLSN
jgi:two-component system, chemotaxis family, chemotaxis protein CheY